MQLFIHIILSFKIGYFVLFCFVCYVKIFLTVCLSVVCLVPSKSPRKGGVHELGFMKFRPMVEKLLIFEVFFELKILKTTFILRSIRSYVPRLCTWYHWKALARRSARAWFCEV